VSFSIAPRIGIDIPISGGRLSLWPQLELGVGAVYENQTAAFGSKEHNRARTWVAFNAPLLLHVTTHFFAGLGPYMMHELSDSDQNNFDNDATTVGVSFLLGGWI
jgi:hypothetical protein